MKQISIIAILLSSFFLGSLSAKGFGKKDIVEFCSDKKSPISGKQFNGESSDQAILDLVAGKYSYPNGGALLLFTNNYYIVKLPTNRNGTHGTSTADLIASGGIVGGCSKEQLSELIAENGLNAESFTLVKNYR